MTISWIQANLAYSLLLNAWYGGSSGNHLGRPDWWVDLVFTLEMTTGIMVGYLQCSTPW